MAGFRSERRSSRRHWLGLGVALFIPLVLLLALVWATVAPALTVPPVGSPARCTFGAGADFSVALKSDGSLWGWGANGTGQLGDESIAEVHAPAHLGTASDWVSVAAGSDWTLAVRSDGSLWGWGANTSGKLGLVGVARQKTPARIVQSTGWVAVAAGTDHSLAIKSDGSLWSWGANRFGQLGDGSTSQRDVPTRVGSASNWVAIAAGEQFSFGIQSDGSLWTWGFNSYFQQGFGDQTQRHVPTRVGTTTGWVAIAAGAVHILALKSDGTLWGCGDNLYGEMGNGSRVYSVNKTFYQIGTATWKSIAAGNRYSLGVKSDGSLWAWGKNDQGQLGDGGTSQQYTPVQIGSDKNWSAVSAGPAAAHSLGLKTDGSLWGWGGNGHGQTGDGSTSNRLRPAQVLSGVKAPGSGGGGSTTSTTAKPSSTTTTAHSGGGTSFSDVSASNPYSTAIANMAALGVIGGFADGTFGPDRPVLRKQFAKMIVGTMGLRVVEDDWRDSNPPFTDCGFDDPSSLYPHDYIAVAKASGLASGKTATRFAPDDNITRAQMITMVVRAAKNFDISLRSVGPDYEGLFKYYTDANHGANVQQAEHNGLLAGLVYNQAATSWIGGNATRGEVAQVLWNLEQLRDGESGGSGGATTSSTTTTTLSPTTTTTAPPATTTTTAGDDQPLFSDDFSTNSRGWSQGSTGRLSDGGRHRPGAVRHQDQHRRLAGLEPGPVRLCRFRLPGGCPLHVVLRRGLLRSRLPVVVRQQEPVSLPRVQPGVLATLEVDQRDPGVAAHGAGQLLGEYPQGLAVEPLGGDSSRHDHRDLRQRRPHSPAH